jgi:hypothetical protein
MHLMRLPPRLVEVAQQVGCPLPLHIFPEWKSKLLHVILQSAYVKHWHWHEALARGISSQHQETALLGQTGMFCMPKWDAYLEKRVRLKQPCYGCFCSVSSTFHCWHP